MYRRSVMAVTLGLLTRSAGTAGDSTYAEDADVGRFSVLDTDALAGALSQTWWPREGARR
jgi:hypothetical protein